MTNASYQHRQLNPHFRPISKNFPLITPNVVSCCKKGWEWFSPKWFIISDVTFVKYQDARCYLPSFSLSPSNRVAQKTFCENLISFFDYFLCLLRFRRRRFSEKCFNLWKPEISRRCCCCCDSFFFYSRIKRNKSLIYYLSFRWCMSFNLHFLNGKRTTKERRKNAEAIILASASETVEPTISGALLLPSMAIKQK